MNLKQLATDVTHEKSLKKRDEKFDIFMRALMSTKEGRKARERVIAKLAKNLGDSSDAGLEF